MRMEVAPLAKALADAKSNHRFVEVAAYDPSSAFAQNEYCLFIKPELTDDAVRFERAAAMILEKVCSFGHTVVAGAAMDAEYMERHHVIEEHYGVINVISRLGREALSDAANATLIAKFASDLERGMLVLGAHQFLCEYPFFTPKALAIFFDNLGSVKLGGGTHSARANMNGQAVLILNGFHPEQLERYIAPGSAIVALAIRAESSWKSIRNELTGSTHPDAAASSSIRGDLFARREYFGLKEVTAGSNGVHVSAGPLEGMLEVCRYLSNLDEQRRELINTTFGRLLIRAGLGGDQVAQLSANPTVELDGRRVSVFDLTEEMDASPAADLIGSVTTQLVHA